jgi:hypothetical protein
MADLVKFLWSSILLHLPLKKKISMPLLKVVDNSIQNGIF